MATLLITAAKVIELAIINQNVDDAYIKNAFIEAAQFQGLKPILTEDLFDFMVAGTGYDAKHTTLKEEYIWPFLAFKTVEFALPFIQNELTAQGIQINVSEFAKPGTDQQRADLVNAAKRMSDIYAKKITEYIEHEDNIDTFDEHYESATNIRKDSRIIGGIIFGNTVDEDDETIIYS